MTQSLRQKFYSRYLDKVSNTFELGPYNQSGEWKGVMGDIVSGKHSVSLSAWNWIIERDSFLDFVPVVKDRQILSVIPKPPEVDPGLFIR